MHQLTGLIDFAKLQESILMIYLKSKLKQDGLALLEYVQTKGDTFSIQRVALIAQLKG